LLTGKPPPEAGPRDVRSCTVTANRRSPAWNRGSCSPAQVAAGAILAGLVWKCFERVEAVLNDKTKSQVAAWLLDVKLGDKAVPWYEALTDIFYRLFGKRHISHLCVWRSVQLTATTFCLPALFVMLTNTQPNDLYSVTISSLTLFLFVSLPTYLSLLQTRLILWLLEHLRGFEQLYTLLLDFVMKLSIFIAAMKLTMPLVSPFANAITTRSRAAAFELFEPLCRSRVINCAGLCHVDLALALCYLRGSP
jgi:hypothetical protein